MSSEGFLISTTGKTKGNGGKTKGMKWPVGEIAGREKKS